MRFLSHSVVAVLAATAVVALSTLPASAADQPDLTGKNYVALGDSYSAGFGLIPFSDEPAPGCFQALANYPHLIAAQYGLTLDDRTCSGAVTANIIGTPQPTITGQGTAPVQSLSLSADTDLVTVTIGGNDLGFSAVAASCLAQSATGPLAFAPALANCRSLYVFNRGGVDVNELKNTLETTVVPALQATFALIKQQAPNAKVIVVGYPSIAPDPANTPVGGCYRSPFGESGPNPTFPQNSFPYTDIDTRFLHETEVQLDAAIGAAAVANGATYISTTAQSESHSACATDDPYVNGITLTTNGAPNSQPIPDTPYAIVLGALHPNEAGVAFLQQQVAAAIDTLFAEPVTDPSPSPSASTTGAPANIGPVKPVLAESGPGPVAPIVAGAFAALLAGAGLVTARRRAAARAASR